MKVYITAFLVITVYCLFSCSGPRNIYSASPFVSPVPMEKGATAVEANYFAHTRQTDVGDSVPGNHDNSLGLILSHMLNEKALVFAYADVKKERNQYHDSINVTNDLSFNAYNAGFDSSVVVGKRHSFGAGIEIFSKHHGKVTTSVAGSVSFHQFDMDESGLLAQTPYHRFYKLNQLSLALQGNLLFNVNNSFKLGWVNRLTVVNNFKAHTDYSSGEKINAGLRDKSVDVFLCITGLYAQYKLLKKIPVYINGQFFNDLAFWKHSMAKYEPGRIFIKGTGISVGVNYVFKTGR